MIIGITGKKRSGKDTIADYLIDTRAFGGYKFATPIKNAVADIFLWDDRWVNGEFKETVDPRWGISPRQAQQVMGTELFRERMPEVLEDFSTLIGSDIWVKRFQYWYEGLPEHFNVVVSDVRFKNEAAIITAMGGKIIRVKRDVLESNDTHASEVEMEMIEPHYVVVNNGTIPELHAKISILYKAMLSND